MTDQRYFEPEGPADENASENTRTAWDNVPSTLTARVSKDFIESQASPPPNIASSFKPEQRLDEVTSAGLYKFLQSGAVCLGDELIKQFYVVVYNKDEAGMKYLFNNGCIFIKPGLNFSLLDYDDATAHIRLYMPHEQTIEAWTSIANVKPSQ